MSPGQGLDSAATYDITKTLLKACRILGNTALVSLLQPPPETLDLFDDILLVDQGRVMYHGPRADAIAYFDRLGFAKPNGKDVGDYLQEVTHPIDGRKYVRPAAELGGRTPPKNAEEFASAWARTPTAQAMAAKLSDKGSYASSNPLDAAAATMPQYPLSTLALAKIVAIRQWKVLLENKTFLKARVGQNVVMGTLFGLLMFQISFENYFLKSNLLLNFSMFIGLSANSLIPNVIQERNVFYKQSRQNFYPAAVHAVADAIVSIPFLVFDVFVFGSLIYFLCGLTLSGAGAHYFIFLLIGISYAFMMGCTIRLCAYGSPDGSSAVGVTILFVLFSIIFSGARPKARAPIRTRTQTHAQPDARAPVRTRTHAHARPFARAHMRVRAYAHSLYAQKRMRVPHQTADRRLAPSCAM